MEYFILPNLKTRLVFLVITGGVFALAWLALNNRLNETTAQADATGINYFMKIDGVAGDSSDAQHKDWIVLDSWSWGVSQNLISTMQGATATTGSLAVQDISIIKTFDKSSPQLMLACANGTPIKKIELAGKYTGMPGDFMAIILENAMCTSFQLSGQGDSNLIESLSFNFAKVKLEYKDQNNLNKSGIVTGWDFQKNIPY